MLKVTNAIKINKKLYYGAPGGIRTPDLPVRSRTLYPTKLLVHTLYYNCFFNNIQVIYQKNLKNLKKIIAKAEKVCYYI